MIGRDKTRRRPGAREPPSASSPQPEEKPSIGPGGDPMGLLNSQSMVESIAALRCCTRSAEAGVKRAESEDENSGLELQGKEVEEDALIDSKENVLVGSFATQSGFRTGTAVSMSGSLMNCLSTYPEVRIFINYDDWR
ncbi:hypothetical protein CYMTET_4072 [Cymbomonas tetramitiformis]|uniref:Uncharacterized protein n=1 Tax=Cymbomonas tetramitiformis TaxID=36881 RepID=A0AAE0LKS1_9CHLO|nr:hypothetical protein CYMTET_4072 [Cymbomonas tetramitiformis]